MADIRTLKLALLADTAQFTSGLKGAENDTMTFSKSISNAGKVAAKAFLAVGVAAAGAAVAIGVGAVKAAIEDQQSQENLAKALRNTTKATDDQVKATEAYITKAQNATGVTDTKLRSALGNLVRATGDATKAQKLNNLALDIAFATGNDLETVSLALAKAYNGQIGALTRLGIPLDANIIKTKDFDAATKVLSETFGGAAAANAETFAGKMEIIKRRVEDAQEAIGYALLPFLDKLSSFVQTNVVPAIEGLVDGLTGKEGVKKAFYDAGTGTVTYQDDLVGTRGAAYLLGISIKDLATRIGDLTSKFGAATDPESGLVKLINFFSALIDKINAAISAYETFKSSFIGGALLNISNTLNPASYIPAVARDSAQNININISGAVDKVGTARTVATALNNAAKQGVTNKLSKSMLY